jgi:cob(I)alamin adenosyltransferase
VKIYTRTGDKGETGLIGGRRVSKADPRILAYGAVDELNTNIGVAISFISKNQLLTDLVEVLVKIQNDLFVAGSDLADASYPEERANATRVTEKMSSDLEQVIDRFEGELNPITYFILPGGSVESSLLHNCRAVSRRAETAAVSLSKVEQVNPALCIYLNRLSDLLFVSARVANKRNGVVDVAWKQR